MYIEIGSPGHGEDFFNGLNAINKRYLRKQINRLLKHLTATFDVLGMLNYASNK